MKYFFQMKLFSKYVNKTDYSLFTTSPKQRSTRDDFVEQLVKNCSLFFFFP